MLEKMVSALEKNKNTAYAYCGFLWAGKKFAGRRFDEDALKKMNYIHTTSLIRKEFFPGFDESIKRFQDWDLWLTILENSGCGILIDEYLFEVRNVRGRKNISKWLPSIFYRFPWEKIGWVPRTIINYRIAEDIIKKKHNL
jgi:hypothetical protein